MKINPKIVCDLETGCLYMPLSRSHAYNKQLIVNYVNVIKNPHAIFI